jgi:tyrosyl-DNA phosphodiesterase 2
VRWQAYLVLKMISMMYPAKFDAESGGWHTDMNGTVNIEATELTFVTFNVWFAQYYLQERCQALLGIVRDCNADIICLQEIKPGYLGQILKQDWVQADYSVSDYTGITVQPYGVLLLSRLPIFHLRLHSLPSVMGRKLLVALFQVNNQTFQVATVHLESLPAFAATRKQQLAQIFPALEKSEHAALMGDFNFCASWYEENMNIDPAYQDMWPVLRSQEPGYTENTDINLMRLEQTGKHTHVRFDRMLIRSSTAEWQPKSINLLGTRPISPQYAHVFPSDHFGLVGTLEWKADRTIDSRTGR